MLDFRFNDLKTFSDCLPMSTLLEEWNMMNLALLQNFDPGAPTLTYNRSPGRVE